MGVLGRNGMLIPNDIALTALSRAAREHGMTYGKYVAQLSAKEQAKIIRAYADAREKRKRRRGK